MRKILLTTAAVMLLASGGAWAQSQQGGYLGLNPGKELQTAKIPAETMTDSPAAWCRFSPEPSRCRARAAVEHEMCRGKEGASYASCRFAMDQMHPY